MHYNNDIASNSLNQPEPKIAEAFGSSCLAKAEQPQEQRYPFLPVCAVFACVPVL